MQVADAFVRYLANTKELEKTIGPGGPVDAAGAKGATSVAGRFKTALQGTTAVAGIAGGAFFSTALEGATKLEDQMRTVNTVAGLSDAELGGLTDKVQALSRETGASTDDLTSGLYDLVSAGVPAAQAIDVLRDSAKLGIGALGTTGEAVDAVTSALNAYELGADQSTKVTDILAKAVADGKVTISEIGASIANIAPIAASAGISLEEVSAGYAALTAKGVPAAQASTQMRAAISALLTPNAQLNELQKETGINFAELAKDKGLAVALEAIRKATKGNNDEFAKSLGSVEAYSFALATTGENADGFATQIEETMGAAGIAEDQYAEKSKSAAEQGKRLFATLSTFAQDVGGPFVGSLGSGAFALNEMGKAFGLPISPAQLLGGAIGGVASKAISGLTALPGKIIPMLAGFIPMVATAATGLGSAIGGFIAAAIPIAMALLPFLLIAALVAAIIFLINNPEILAKIGEVIGGILDAIASFLGELGRIFYGAFQRAIELVKIAINAIVGFILALPGRVVGFVGDLLRHFFAIQIRAAQAIGKLVSDVVSFILSIPGKVAAFVGNLVGMAARAAGGFLAKIVGLGGDVIRTLLGIPGRVVGALVSAFVNVAKRVVSGFLGVITAIPGKIAEILGGVGDFIGGLIPRFDVGALNIPHDMLAVVHKGEMIIPAAEAEAIRQGRSGLGSGGGGGGTAAPAAAGGGVTVHVYNPTPEPASTSTKRELSKLAAFGRTS